MAAFEAACEAGHPIELDVHPSVDGEAVVFHDTTLERLVGRPQAVYDVPWHRLRNMSLSGTSQTIPRLADVVQHVDGRVPIVVEIKNERAVGVIERAVARSLQTYRGEIAIQSFNPLSLGWFRRHAPHYVRGLLAGDMSEQNMWQGKKFVLEHVLLAPWVQPHYVGYDLRKLPTRATSWLRRQGTPLLAWTVRNEQDQAAARELADNYIFEGVAP